MDWLQESLELFFLGIIERIEQYKNTFFGDGFNLLGFLNYVWYYCIPNQITDLVLFAFCLLFFFALKKLIK